MNVTRMAPATLDRDTDYKLTIGTVAHPIKDYVGQTIPVKAIALLEDTNAETGETRVFAHVVADDGECYSTQSVSFIRNLIAAWDYAERWKISIDALKISTGRSKNGRDYLTCEPVFSE